VSSTPRHVVVIGTDCTCSCKSNYYTITTTTAPFIILEDYEENIFQFDMVINFQLLVQYSLYDLLHMWKILEYHKTPPTFRKLLTKKYYRRRLYRVHLFIFRNKTNNSVDCYWMKTQLQYDRLSIKSQLIQKGKSDTGYFDLRHIIMVKLYSCL
jgi:hypothetical protein